MKYIIANWKMNIPNCFFAEYCQTLLDKANNKSIIIAPPNIYLKEMMELSEGGIFLASQDVAPHKFKYGAYTGDLSAAILKDVGVDYCIIGHSERREQGLEPNNLISKKIECTIHAGITPIICIGEKMEARSQGAWASELQSQIEEAFFSIEDSVLNNNEFMIAYEPLWAIGSGVSASNKAIEEAISLIEEMIYRVAKNPKIIYGGSVNKENVTALSLIPNLSGVLIGKASLDIEEFLEIIKNYA